MQAENYFPIRVYYEDTDAGGVVYHARYLHFFERARTEWLREKGISQQLLKEQLDLAFVVAAMDIKFHQVAKLDDKLVVKTILKQSKKATFIFEQSLWRDMEDDKEFEDVKRLISTVLVTVASVKLSVMKPYPLPIEIRSLLI